MKLRSDSVWNELSTEQWQTLEAWLFDENISYTQAVERLQKEWGLKRSRSSVVRFRQHCLKNRVVDDLPEAIETAREINQTGAKPEEFCRSTLTVVRKRLLESALDPANLNELVALGRLVNQCEDRQIRRQRLDLARQRWQFNASKAALHASTELNDFAQEEEKRDLARIEIIKRKLFGKECDLIIE